MKKIYLLAVIAALITAFATYQFATSIERKALSQVQGSVDVVVAAAKIEENTILNSDMVEIKQISKELIGNDVAKSKEEVIGKIVQYPISPGEPIYPTRLFKAGVGESSNRLAYEIPQGYRAVSITVDDVTGVAGFLKKGDRVDVVAYFTGEQKGERKIAFENLLILRTGSDVNSGSNAGAKYTSVTFAVTPQQAIDLNYVVANAIIRLVLRSPVDE